MLGWEGRIGFLMRRKWSYCGVELNAKSLWASLFDHFKNIPFEILYGLRVRRWKWNYCRIEYDAQSFFWHLRPFISKMFLL